MRCRRARHTSSLTIAPFRPAAAQEVSKSHESHMSSAKIKDLIESGADANYRDPYGYTPLFYASRASADSIVNQLLVSGADSGSLKAVYVDKSLMLGVQEPKEKGEKKLSKRAKERRAKELSDAGQNVLGSSPHKN